MPKVNPFAIVPVFDSGPLQYRVTITFCLPLSCNMHCRLHEGTKFLSHCLIAVLGRFSLKEYGSSFLVVLNCIFSANRYVCLLFNSPDDVYLLFHGLYSVLGTTILTGNALQRFCL
jgi:hypothetical protein